MGYLLPPLVAFLQTASGAFIFAPCKCHQAQLASSLTFQFSIFVFLWKTKVFPSSTNLIHQAASIVLLYFISLFLMEHLMNDFWFPLEGSLHTFLPKVANFESYVWRQFGMHPLGVLSFFKWHIFAASLIYGLAIFCLIAVLRIVAGPSLREFRNYLRKKMRNFLQRNMNRNADINNDGVDGFRRNWKEYRGLRRTNR